MRFRSVAAVLAVLAVGVLAYAVAEPIQVKATAAAPVANKIWTGLVVATNAREPKAAPAELQEFAPRMKRVFGYNQFELASSVVKELGDRGESAIELGKGFKVDLKARRALSKEAQGGYLLSLQLLHEDRPLVDTEAKLAPGSPLFIRGPRYGHGHLIIVLQVQR